MKNKISFAYLLDKLAKGVVFLVYFLFIFYSLSFFLKNFYASAQWEIVLDQDCYRSSCTYDFNWCTNCGSRPILAGYCRGDCGEAPRRNKVVKKIGDKPGNFSPPQCSYYNTTCQSSLQSLLDSLQGSSSEDDLKKAFQSSKVFYKSIARTASTVDYYLPETRLDDDSVEKSRAVEEPISLNTVGFVDAFLSGTSKMFSVFNNKCTQQLREYGYIYIPSDGWYSFGYRSNLTGLEPGACYYCPFSSPGVPYSSCNGNNRNDSFARVSSGHCRGSYKCSGDSVDLTCSYNSYSDCDFRRVGSGDEKEYICYGTEYKTLTPPPSFGCKPNCGGKIYTWISNGGGSGTQADPFLPSPYIPPDESIEAPEIPPSVKLDYTYSWLVSPTTDCADCYKTDDNIESESNVKLRDDKVTRSGTPFGVTYPNGDFYFVRHFPDNNEDSNLGTAVADADLEIDLGSEKFVDYLTFDFLYRNQYGQVINVPKEIWVFCDGERSGVVYPRVLFKASNNTTSYTEDRLSVPLRRNCSSLRVKYYIGIAEPGDTVDTPTYLQELKVWGQNNPIVSEDAVRVDNVLEENVRRQDWSRAYSFSFDSYAVDRSNPVDTVFFGPKYFKSGWYLTQMSIANLDGSRIYGPQFLWRRCTSSDPSSCGQAYPYEEDPNIADGNQNPLGARLSPCQPASTPCQCTIKPSIPPFVSGETKDVTLVTLGNYDRSSVSVSSSDTSVLSINSTSVDDAGNVKVNATAGQVDEVKTVTLNISANSSDESELACGTTDVPCSVSVIVRPGKFWQAKDADVIALNDIASYIPEGSYLLTKGSNTSGIAFYNGNIRIGEGSVSESGWGAVKTNIASVYNLYNYSYFEGKVPSEVRNGWGNSQGVINSPVSPLSLSNFTTGNNSILKDNYYWTKVNGDLQISSSSNFDKKLMLFVNGKVTIKGDITLRNADVGNNGFLMVIATGDIEIDPAVTRIDGIFVSDSSFSTGTRGSRQDSQLKVNGTVIASNVILRRSLPVSQAQTTPAELFEYKPNLLFSIPYYFHQRNLNWREVNP